MITSNFAITTKLPYNLSFSLSFFLPSLLFSSCLYITPSFPLCQSSDLFPLQSPFLHFSWSGCLVFSVSESFFVLGLSPLRKKIWFFAPFFLFRIPREPSFLDLGCEGNRFLSFQLWGKGRGRILVACVATITNMKKGKCVRFAVTGFRLDRRKLRYKLVLFLPLFCRNFFT